VAFAPGNGSSAITLSPREVLAGDAAVSPEGGGFTGVTLSHPVRSEERVDAELAEAERAGGTIARPAQKAKWDGYFGYSPTRTATCGRSSSEPRASRSRRSRRTLRERPTFDAGERPIRERFDDGAKEAGFMNAAQGGPRTHRKGAFGWAGS
jgi:hypothetical protein